ncbi:DUF7452 domain-containing protein [Cerasicoccus fimbriatus]|uniref:DUF7452 domain-containing protein n=1 Tax=Cerasicoccus fimbriatus TaxID=3014554 RepID=UPI0022B412EB|nr:hypothetical protein [Cerasicoccus sp. TK19100]
MSPPCFSQLFTIGLTAILCALSIPLNAALEAFTHTATAENTTANATTLDHATTNDRPQHLLLITGNLGELNPHHLRARYDTVSDRWQVINEDGAPMTLGAKFNVLAVDPASKHAFRVTASSKNRTRGGIMVSHPASDFNPTARLFVTTQDSETPPMGALSTSYNGVYWIIQREDGQPIPDGARFNVIAVQEGKTESLGMTPFKAFADTHTIDIGNTRNNATAIKYIDSQAKLFVFRYRTGPGENAAAPVLRYDGSDWQILHHDYSPLERHEVFNCLHITPSYAATERVDAGNLNIGWLIIDNRASYAARLKLDFLLENTPRSLSTPVLQPGSKISIRVPERAVELKLTGDITDGKTIQSPINERFDAIPNATLRFSGDLQAPKWELVE